MASGPIEGVSLSLKLADIWEKLGTAYTVVKGMLPGGRFQMATVNVRGHPIRVFKNLPPALGDYYRPFMDMHAAKDLCVYGDEHYTFQAVAEQMHALGAELLSTFGLQRGDKVAIGMRNLPEFLIAFLGITAAGLVAVPLNALWKTDELQYALKDSGSKVLIADPERLKSCAPFLRDMGVQAILCRGDDGQAAELGATSTWAAVLAQGKGKPRPSVAGVQADDMAMIMYTSGSTGFPKGVVHTQRSVGTTMKIGELLSVAQPEVDPKTLLAVPLFHITALAFVFLWCVPSGTALFMMRKWDAGEALKLIEKNRITRFTGVPTMVRDMLEHPTFSAEVVKSVKNMSAGGAPVPPAQVDKLYKKTGKASATQGYGLTENPLVTFNKGVDYLKHPTSCGKPVPLLVEVKVQDPETKKWLPDGQRGELCIRSAMLMQGYHNKPEETAKAIDAEGFFHTGDVAKVEGGFVYILDRLKDLIIRGGENIDCSEVEAALYTHPAVRECSVFGIPDERLGEVVGAAVWWQGDKKPTPADLAAHVASKVAGFKVPQQEYIFLHDTELPKGATGKLDKKGLREKYKVAAKGPPMSKL